MLVKDFMTTKIIAAHPSDNLKDGAKKMIDNKLSILPVVDEENVLLGVLTNSDFLGKDVYIPRAMVSLRRLLGQIHYDQNVEDLYKSAANFSIEKVMTKGLTTISPEASLNEAVNLMIKRGHKRLPVVDDGKLVGIITRRDLVKAFYQLNKN